MHENTFEKNLIDLTGKKFFKLLVIGFDHKKEVVYKNNRKRVTYFWKCKCECGTEVVRSGNSLRGGYTKSCGCNQVRENKLTHNRKKELNIKPDTRKKDLTGMVFSKLMVLGLDYVEQSITKNGRKRNRYYWKCMCECGEEVIRLGESLRNGATKSCGCYKFYQQMLGYNKKKYLKDKNRYIELEEEFE